VKFGISVAQYNLWPYAKRYENFLLLIMNIKSIEKGFKRCCR